MALHPAACGDAGQAVPPLQRSQNLRRLCMAHMHVITLQSVFDMDEGILSLLLIVFWCCPTALYSIFHA